MFICAQYDGRACADQLDSRAAFAAPDDRETVRVLHGREKLVILAEGEVLWPGALGERDPVEIDDEAAARPVGDVARVPRDPIGEVEHRVRVRREATALLQANR